MKFKGQNDIGYSPRCQICSYMPLELVLSLGHQFPVSSYLSEKDLHQAEISYPLNFCRCRKCGLLQLDYLVDPRINFPFKYPYRSGLTNMLIRNFENLAECLIEAGYAKKDDLIIDIGSNDGTLLKSFKKRGMKVLGIEPTDVADVANKSGIPTVQEFINRKAVKSIVRRYGKASVVIATNTFAHIPDMPELMRNIKKLLADGGIFVSESQERMVIAQDPKNLKKVA